MLTTPSNPGGLVWGRHEIIKIIDMCKAVGSWVVVDQVYHEFLHDSAGRCSLECSGYVTSFASYLAPRTLLIGIIYLPPMIYLGDSLQLIFCDLHKNMTCVSSLLNFIFPALYLSR